MISTVHRNPNRASEYMPYTASFYRVGTDTNSTPRILSRHTDHIGPREMPGHSVYSLPDYRFDRDSL